MTSNDYLTNVTNVVNDAMRSQLEEVVQRLKEGGLLTQEIKMVIRDMYSSVKTNKKVKKEKVPRFSGYHLFLKEYRKTVQLQQPGIKPQDLTRIVSKGWKKLSDSEQDDFNTRALKLKDEYFGLSSSSSNGSVDSDDDIKDVVKVVKKSDKNINVILKNNKNNKSSEYLKIREADSDIDL